MSRWHPENPDQIFDPLDLMGTRPLFSRMHQQLIYKGRDFTKDWAFPNSELASEFGLFLPSGIATKTEHTEFICEETGKLK